MIEIKGKYTNAIIFADEADQESMGQIAQLCSKEWMKDNKTRIMPDFHVGAGCVIGTTIEIKNGVEPNIVGVDIGCGVTVVPLKDKHIEPLAVDKFIKMNIPHGFNVHDRDTKVDWDLEELLCKSYVPTKNTYKAIGTLGGGNHYLEISKDDEGKLYLSVHSGSRNLGLQVATHYQKRANSSPGKYLSGKDFANYIHDMKLMQRYASLNRQKVLELIIKGCGLKVDKSSEWNINTIHNYIDTESMIVRKGAVSALKDEKLVIPMNMRDGSLLCIGKGNSNWNYSAPHGAGRLYSRSQAKEKLSMEEFKKSMEGIYTTSVSTATLDEAPMTYKDMESIVKQITDTVDIVKRIVPIYNFKSA